MKILYAPYNIASMPAITLDALKKYSNLEVKGISIVNPKYLSFGEDPQNTWKVFDVFTSIKNPFALIKNIVLAEFYLCKRILWADVIIWQWDTRVYLPHFWFLKFSGKPILVEWVGSDIRVPEIVMGFNIYYKQVFENKTYGYLNESASRSLWIQRKFKFLKAIPYACHEMTLYINKQFFPNYFKTFQRVDLRKYKPSYPDRTNPKCILVHTPSSIGGKGTYYVREVIQKLKLNYDFEYVEVSNKTHAQALAAIGAADIFLDQFISGSYGMATCEALAMGKPVFCYLMEPMVKLLPEDCPLVNANLDILEEKLIEYLNNAELRYQTGLKSRAYVEKYHDADKLAGQLLEIIKTLV